MDVMFGQELPHMGLMGRATSGQYIDPGLDYASLGYPQIQVTHDLPLRSRLYLQSCMKDIASAGYSTSRSHLVVVYDYDPVPLISRTRRERRDGAKDQQASAHRAGP